MEKKYVKFKPDVEVPRSLAKQNITKYSRGLVAEELPSMYKVRFAESDSEFYLNKDFFQTENELISPRAIYNSRRKEGTPFTYNQRTHLNNGYGIDRGQLWVHKETLNQYSIIGVAIDKSNSDRLVVIYQPLYDCDTAFFTREISEFSTKFTLIPE